MRTPRSRLITVAAAMLLVACGQAGAGDGGSPLGSWQLQSGTVDGAPVPIVADHQITLAITEDDARGLAACNEYGGPYTLSGDEIGFGELARNGMACADEEVMTSQRVFLDGLERVTSFRISGESMTLSGDAVELVFVPNSAATDR